MTNIKPIETIYNGCKFRSRLEARWAVFFDAVGVKWDYEPEGFDLGGGIKYLPDFILHDVDGRWCGIGMGNDLYVEVKGELKLNDQAKVGAFKRPILLVGSIPKGDTIFELILDAKMNDCGGWFYNSASVDGDNYTVIPAINKDGKFELVGADWDLSKYKEAETVEAYNAARMARFEHFDNSAPMTKQQYANDRAETLESIDDDKRIKLRQRKKYVSIPHSWRAFFMGEESDVVKRMILNIIAYSETGQEPDFKNNTDRMVFEAFIRPELDNDFDKFCLKQV